jgi:hypothetical protein
MEFRRNEYNEILLEDMKKAIEKADSDNAIELQQLHNIINDDLVEKVWECESLLKEKGFIDYEENITQCVSELIDRVKKNGNILSMDNYSNEQIYPFNAELMKDFTFEYGFDSTEFVLFLIARSDNKLEYDNDNIVLN